MIITAATIKAPTIFFILLPHRSDNVTTVSDVSKGAAGHSANSLQLLSAALHQCAHVGHRLLTQPYMLGAQAGDGSEVMGGPLERNGC